MSPTKTQEINGKGEGSLGTSACLTKLFAIDLLRFFGDTFFVSHILLVTLGLLASLCGWFRVPCWFHRLLQIRRNVGSFLHDSSNSWSRDSAPIPFANCDIVRKRLWLASIRFICVPTKSIFLLSDTFCS